MTLYQSCELRLLSDDESALPKCKRGYRDRGISQADFLGSARGGWLGVNIPHIVGGYETEDHSNVNDVLSWLQMSSH